MTYNNQSVRRQDRLLDEERALELLREAEYGVLSMVDADGQPYGIPVNFVWDGADSLYVHCAPEGRKLRAIRHCAEVSFCVVGRVHLLPSQFTTEYESVVLRATATVCQSDEERRKALRLLLQKLSPNDMEKGLRYTEHSLPRTAIIRLHILEMSGKQKRVGKKNFKN
ncbi:MAG: pyridoxamine 5'-phosphate oxidase family protein [Bacteroidaceae bacterium]|nr:pyridoxamine 5'-phosphate oxidase family protein [Bacteroidaceae bacterium]